MFQIDTPSTTATQPTPNAVGSPGWFQHGNAATGTPFTVVSSDWCNIIQAELLNLLTYAGITAAKTNQTQVAQAVSLLHGIQAWSASGTFTVPAYVYKIKVICTGAGGGLGGCVSAVNGGGGGAGGTAIGYYTVTPGSVITITVGAGGTAGTAGANAGGTGGTTTVGALCSASGGTGGNNTGTTAAGGAGGVGASGQVNATGGNGGAGSAGAIFSGNGAASFWGGGGEATTVVGALGNGQAFGSGAGGSVYTGSNLAGMTGCAGVVVIEW